MKVLDLTLPTPAENLALDEALLDCAEAGQGSEVLRFWEPKEYFVVVGYANKVDAEVKRADCEKMRIPVLRRCSGGGTVLQGPSCLNYTLILRIALGIPSGTLHPGPLHTRASRREGEKPPIVSLAGSVRSPSSLATIPQTNCFVMNRQKEALQMLLKETVEVRGHTDLAIGDFKFSGNAQRRKRDFLIFHGTFLLNFDLAMIEKLLPMPSKEPDYRSRRSHKSFLKNVNLSSAEVKTALQMAWSAAEPLEAVPDYRSLVGERYERPEWNFKF